MIYYSDEGSSCVNEEEQKSYASLVEEAKRAIDVVYDSLFTKFFFKSKKGLILGGLISKFEQISQRTLRTVNYYDNSPIKIYYILFAVIKSVGYRINFNEFSEIIF